ncbi:MAG: cell division protein FtsQ/DivIB [Eubacteriales bacterium]|nr:cell division protein FtsQ/DivIB [Eubacteriales bacterium]
MKNNNSIRKKKSRHMLRRIVLIAAAAFLVLGVGVYYIFQVKTIEYVGNKHYTSDEMNERLFHGRTPNALMYKLFGGSEKSIPFIQKVDVDIDLPDKMYITVYEKAVIGYINYMGCNMYFDKDGIIVESSTQEYEGVPEILGLKFKSIVLDSKLDVGSDKVFQQILDLTQSFNKYQLDVDKVYFNSCYEVTLYMGEVKVLLGSEADMTDKLFELKQMEEKLTGLKGTLHLENYSGTDFSVIFKKEN